MVSTHLFASLKNVLGVSQSIAYGPCQSDLKPPVIEESYKLIAYVDDVKPAITAEDEFLLVDMGSLLFEKSSGCELHRDPSSGKVKFLPLGKWRGKMKQQDYTLIIHYFIRSFRHAWFGA